MRTGLSYSIRGAYTLVVVASLILSGMPMSTALAGAARVEYRDTNSPKAGKSIAALYRSPDGGGIPLTTGIVPLDADDTITGAIAISPSPVAGTLDAADDPTDVYSISLTAGTRLRVVLTGATSLNADAYLYDPLTTNENASSAVAGTLGDSFPKMLTYDVPAGGGGLYHVAIDSAAGFGSYTITWQVVPVPSAIDDDITGVVPSDSVVVGDLNEVTDTDDVYRVNIGAGQRLVAGLVADANVDFDLYLYDKDATGLGDDLPIGGSSASGSGESFVFEVPSGDEGQYYVDVHCVNGVGAYTLTWTVSDVPAGAIEVAANATAMGSGSGTVSNTLDRAADVNDYYKWTLSVDQRIEATLTASVGTDFDVYLYGPDGVTTLAWSNDSVYPEHLVWDVTQAGVYYIEVVSFSGAGTYSLGFSVAPTPAWSTTVRREGRDRYATAVSLSQCAYAAGSVSTVVLATGEDFPDALSAAGLAGVYQSPVLLTRTASLPAIILTEMQRLGVRYVVVVGGPPAVGAGVMTALQNAGLSVSRVSGANRYATSAAVADRIAVLKGSAFTKTAFVTRGDQFPDALALAPFAYSQAYPVLLTRTTSLSPECSSVVDRLGIREIYIAGSTVAVSANVEAALDALPSVNMKVSRLAGNDRYETAAVIAQRGVDFWWGDARYVGIATGRNFPDALGGGALCGVHGGVLLLTDPSKLSAPAANFISAHSAEILATEVYGAPAAVSDSVKASISTLMND